jgi:hypothetical protein
MCYGSPVLPLDVSILQEPVTPGHVCSTAAYAAAACVYLQQIVLPLKAVLPLDLCMFYSSFCCPWTVDNEHVWFTTACAAPGHVSVLYFSRLCCA